MRQRVNFGFCQQMCAFSVDRLSLNKIVSDKIRLQFVVK